MLQKLSLVLILLVQVLVVQPLFAGVKGANTTNRYSSNPVYVRNHSTSNLAYVVHGTEFFNSLYGVQQNSYDIYHAGLGDERAYIEIGICDDFQFPDRCNQPREMKSCVNSYYDINYVSDIYIGADMKCTIRCTDGSSTSCKR
jgi:hypothetical protein